MTIITDKGMGGMPSGADQWLTESFSRGAGALLGRITPNGERRFYFRYTGSAGKQVRLPIGPYKDKGDGASTFTVQQARARALELSALYRGGIRDLREHFAALAEGARLEGAAERLRQEKELADERDRQEVERLARERRLTLRQLHQRWESVELQPHKTADGRRAGRADGGKLIREQFALHLFPLLGDRAVQDVTRADLFQVFDALRAAGKLRALSMMLVSVKQMFRFAVTRELVDRSPVEGVMRRDVGGSATERDRALSADEISLLAVQLGRVMTQDDKRRRLPEHTVAAVWIVLSTGCRVGELLGTAWAGVGVDASSMGEQARVAGVKFGTVDLVGHTWHLPDTKNQRSHTIHLSDFALRQFQAIKDAQGTGLAKGAGRWVFPCRSGEREGGPIRVTALGKQFSDRQQTGAHHWKNRTRDDASLALPGGRWTAHDLRRTAATTMARLGIAGDVIDECLNHVVASRVRRTYIRDRREAQQAAAFDVLGMELDRLVGGGERLMRGGAANVVPIRAAA